MRWSHESAPIHRITWKLAQNIVEIWIKQSYLVKLCFYGIMVAIYENENGADIKATNRKFDFKGNFSGNTGGTGLFHWQNKLVLTKSRLFLCQIALIKFQQGMWKNGTDISDQPEVRLVVHGKVGCWCKIGTSTRKISTEQSRNMIINVRLNNFFWMHNLLINEAILKIKHTGTFFAFISPFLFLLFRI